MFLVGRVLFLGLVCLFLLVGLGFVVSGLCICLMRIGNVFLYGGLVCLPAISGRLGMPPVPMYGSTLVYFV